MSTTTGTARSGMKATGPATSQITLMKRNANGRSANAIKVAEVKNSRTDSYPPRFAARAPTEAGRAS